LAILAVRPRLGTTQSKGYIYWGSIAAQLAVAGARDPGNGLDLSELNLADPQELFRKKAA